MTNKPTWEEQYEKEIVPEIRKSVVNYSRFANSNRNASYDAYEALTKGNSLVSNNHTADLQYKLKNFISAKLAEQRKELITELNYTGVGKQEFNESTEHWKGRKQGVEEMKSLIINLTKQD